MKQQNSNMLHLILFLTLLIWLMVLKYKLDYLENECGLNRGEIQMLIEEVRKRGFDERR